MAWGTGRNGGGGNASRSYCRRATAARSSLVQRHGKGVGESLHSAGIHDQAVVRRGHLGRQIQRSSSRVDAPGSKVDPQVMCQFTRARARPAEAELELVSRCAASPDIEIYKCAGTFINVPLVCKHHVHM